LSDSPRAPLQSSGSVAGVSPDAPPAAPPAAAPPVDDQDGAAPGDSPGAPRFRRRPLQIPLLFLSVFIIATCGLGYELIAGTVASYLLGDSVTQFSTAIGLYLFALGIGAYLSRFFDREEDLTARFIDIELAVALLGGFAASILMLTFAHAAWFRPVLYSVIVATGTLVGLEVPLLLRILRHRMEFKELVARVLTVDYVGSLAASLMFPLLLVPRLGLVRTSLLFGLLNAAVGLWSTFLLRQSLRRVVALRLRCIVVLLALLAGFAFADHITSLAEDGLYADDVILSRNSPYQRIVITRGKASFQLFLNGNLQFSSADEYRYHEALVHPAMAQASRSLGHVPRRALILGGGDGLAARELLRYEGIEEITMVDLDPVMTDLASKFPLLKEQNGGALSSPKLHLHNADAMQWLEEHARARDPRRWDVAIVDFPDPSSFAVGKLYTTHFYRLLRAALAPRAVAVVQSTSPLFARRSFWCIVRTLEAGGFRAHPYHAFVPSFGEWGYVLALPRPTGVSTEEAEPRLDPLPTVLPPGLRYVDASMLTALFVLSPDMQRPQSEPGEEGELLPNRLNNQILVSYYEREWKRWN
jgi:spermidine synthase